MSRLGDWETAIVDQLVAVEISGVPVFKTVRGVSGGARPTLREALLREALPGAYVGFTFEPTAPETNILRIGPVYSVLVAARTLRVGSDPRVGDGSTPGALALIDHVREALDHFIPDGLSQLNSLSVSFEYADERAVIYELMYRVYPFFEAAPIPE
ncbi:hypothetical protein RAS2_28170 [Phycisphaerae bacterium RAS2]|nr:hypothetical protein RAS2_28170 [Phycisphaerae bacterium RAS2]